MSMAWGGHKNGQIPGSSMVTVGGEGFEREAGRQVVALGAAFLKRFKKPLIINDGYRDLAQQKRNWNDWVAFRNGGPWAPLAAYWGTSNHGWGKAADFGSGVQSFGTEEKEWMDANAPKYGWHPTGNKFSSPESWHYDYLGNPTIVAGDDIDIITEEEMELMATGVAYKQNDKDTVYWQERPGTPLVPLNAPTWVALKENGLKIRELAASDMKILVRECGYLPRAQGRSATGVAYHNTETGAVYWQEKPGTPLVHLTPVEWDAYRQNGLVLHGFTTAELAPLLK